LKIKQLEEPDDSKFFTEFFKDVKERKSDKAKFRFVRCLMTECLAYTLYDKQIRVTCDLDSFKKS
jgi:hypothetical protein